jgi:hypothetical protein
MATRKRANVDQVNSWVTSAGNKVAFAAFRCSKRTFRTFLWSETQQYCFELVFPLILFSAFADADKQSTIAFESVKMWEGNPWSVIHVMCCCTVV